MQPAKTWMSTQTSSDSKLEMDTNPERKCWKTTENQGFPLLTISVQLSCVSICEIGRHGKLLRFPPPPRPVALGPVPLVPPRRLQAPEDLEAGLGFIHEIEGVEAP